jgi:hypothetical protein
MFVAKPTQSNPAKSGNFIFTDIEAKRPTETRFFQTSDRRGILAMRGLQEE